MPRTLFFPKMTDMTEDDIDKNIIKLEGDLPVLTPFHLLHVRYFSAPHSRHNGTLIKIDGDKITCNSYDKDESCLSEEHPDCEVYELLMA
ncbi:MAG: hypothetical protein NTU81_01280 [Candidatus Nomurabacteria bacterium]|nr:hypothetical protein [Candidatus Nomurabacteria bacterium]